MYRKVKLQMNDLIKCGRCNKVVIVEEYDSHECMPEIKSWKTIKFTNFYILKDKAGLTTIGIRSSDGTKYDFIEVPEDKPNTKIPYEPTLFDSDKNRRRLDRIKNQQV